jgi:hypothetical protein
VRGRVATVLVSAAIAALGNRVFAQGGAASGTICVAPLPKDVREADRLAFSGGPSRRYKYSFTVEIDARPPIAVPKLDPLPIEDLPLEATHRVRIRDEGRPIESFRFTFSARGGTPLCLAYTPGYQTWSLEKRRPGQRWCACEPREAAQQGDAPDEGAQTDGRPRR